MRNGPALPVRLSEAELSQVIRRAIELDSASADGVSLTELQRIAADLDISPDSIARAVEEVQAVRGPVTPTPLETWKLRWRITGAIAAAAFLGGTLLGGKSEIVNFYLFLATAAAAIPYRKLGKSEAYLPDILALWTGFGMGWFIASALKNEGDTAFHLLVPGLAAAAIGWCLLRIQWRWNRELRSTT